MVNRPHSIYQYSNMSPTLLGKRFKHFKFLLSHNSPFYSSRRHIGFVTAQT